jgi:hypothetical protein
VANADSSAAVSLPLGKNSAAKNGASVAVQVEVVPLEHRAERGREYDLLLFLGRALDRRFFQQAGASPG